MPLAYRLSDGVEEPRKYNGIHAKQEEHEYSFVMQPRCPVQERSHEHHANRKATDKLHGSFSGGRGVESGIDLGSRRCPSKGKREKEIDLVKTSRQTGRERGINHRYEAVDDQSGCQIESAGILGKGLVYLLHRPGRRGGIAKQQSLLKRIEL